MSGGRGVGNGHPNPPRPIGGLEFSIHTSSTAR
jgi:hypothetical protein